MQNLFNIKNLYITYNNVKLGKCKQKMIYFYIIIGIIQGLTEFLPISSSGHIIIAVGLFNFAVDLILISIIAHLGTLIAVLIVYKKQVWELIKHPFSKQTLMLVVATIPTVIIVLLFGDFIDKIFTSDYIVAGFLITAIMLLFCERRENKSNNSLNYKDAITMGIFQAIAILPGISRSGSTIAGGLSNNKNKEEVTDFSFLMSIPVIFGSFVMEIIDIGTINITDTLPLTLTFFFSLIFGILSIRWMQNLIKKSKLYYFSIYLLVISFIIIILQIF